MLFLVAALAVTQAEGASLSTLEQMYQRIYARGRAWDDCVEKNAARYAEMAGVDALTGAEGALGRCRREQAEYAEAVQVANITRDDASEIARADVTSGRAIRHSTAVSVILEARGAKAAPR